MPAPKLPAQVRIGYATYDISADPETPRAFDAEGYSDGEQLLIKITPREKHTAQAKVLLHEILHQCAYVSGCTIPEDSEERLVAATAGPLLAALRDNPDLVAYLLAE